MKYKGNVSVGKVAAALLARGFHVFVPLGEGHEYDLIFDTGKLSRVQVKTGRLRNGAVQFSVKSNNGRWFRRGQSRDYHGKVEAFGVYCFENNKSYLIPIEAVGTSCCYLRIDSPKKNQRKGINWAKDFEL